MAHAYAQSLGERKIEHLRSQFPILSTTLRGRPLVYLDNAATTQKPERVLKAEEKYYLESCSNVHRGVHVLSQCATAMYEAARERVRSFLGARRPEEIVFTKGTTEGINLVAQSYGRGNVSRGDEILVTEMEHHSNIVPWQMLCDEKGAQLKVAPIDDRGELDFEAFEKLLSARTRIVAVSHVSNALGTVNPAREIVRAAHAAGARVVIDGAQAAPHLPVDVRALDCDFFAFSGHKVYGPTGVGALYGKYELLQAMAPYQGGGDMILSVTFEKTEYQLPPNRFEAGTPNIAGVIGMAEGLEFVAEVGMERIIPHEEELLAYATEKLSSLPGLRIVGTARKKAGVISFVMEGIHPHDIGTILDLEGIAIRAGHHCAQPVMRRFGVPATARASLALYNTRTEIDALARALGRVREVFRA